MIRYKTKPISFLEKPEKYINEKLIRLAYGIAKKNLLAEGIPAALLITDSGIDKQYMKSKYRESLYK
jgi:hypothetical protein